MSTNEITMIEGYQNCDNCGAFAPEGTPIQHHPTCQPGEARKWEQHYQEAEPGKYPITCMSCQQEIPNRTSEIEGSTGLCDSCLEKRYPKED